MGVTKYILKHPVTTVMALLCLVVFGISSVFSAKLEQMPDMETPMLIIMANYSGAGPEDISELVTEPIEDAIGTLEGVDTISSTSSDGRSMVMLQYDYGTDMDEAYDNLKQKLDNIQHDSRVCFTAVASAQTLPDVFSVRYESAMAFGTAHIVYGEDERIAALQRLCRKYAPQKTQEQLATYMNKLIVHTTVVRLDVEYISGKSSAQ